MSPDEADFTDLGADADPASMESGASDRRAVDEDAMDVEPASGKADSSWIQRGPLDAPPVKAEDEDAAKPAEGEEDVEAQVDKLEDDAYTLLTVRSEVWTEIQSINEDEDAKHKVPKRVNWGSIARRYIDSEGLSNSVPQRVSHASSSQAASPPDEDLPSRCAAPADTTDDNAAMIAYLATAVANLADRVHVLEARSRTGTAPSAPRPNHDAAASASQSRGEAKSGPWQCKKRRSQGAYPVPEYAPWPLGSGWCGRCEHSWTPAESPEHAIVCPNIWESVMNRMFADWDRNKRMCHMKDSYSLTESAVTQALLSCEAITTDDEAEVTASFGRMLWKPDIPQDHRPLFLYHGGKSNADGKYITFGCMHCQRCTTLWPLKDNRFITSLRRYFP